jgi:hypothetical protein
MAVCVLGILTGNIARTKGHYIAFAILAIERISRSYFLQPFPNVAKWPADRERVSGEIAALDGRLQALFLENPFYRHHSSKMWWQLILLKKGGRKVLCGYLQLVCIRIKQVQ